MLFEVHAHSDIASQLGAFEHTMYGVMSCSTAFMCGPEMHCIHTA